MNIPKKLTGFSWLLDKKIQKCLWLLAIGMVLLIAGNLLFSKKEDTKELISPISNEEKAVITPALEVEQRLRTVLSEIKGAGEVSVMVQFSGGSERIPGTDKKISENITEETDASGGSRRVTETQKEETMVETGNAPVILKEYAPQVQGVIIVAEGGGDEGVSRSLKEAAATVLGISGYKVQVFEKETNHKGGN